MIEIYTNLNEWNENNDFYHFHFFFLRFNVSLSVAVTGYNIY